MPIANLIPIKKKKTNVCCDSKIILAMEFYNFYYFHDINDNIWKHKFKTIKYFSRNSTQQGNYVLYVSKEEGQKTIYTPLIKQNQLLKSTAACRQANFYRFLTRRILDSIPEHTRALNE